MSRYFRAASTAGQNGKAYRQAGRAVLYPCQEPGTLLVRKCHTGDWEAIGSHGFVCVIGMGLGRYRFPICL